MSLLTREWGRAMTHDEMKYPDGSKFRPERFLKDDGQTIEFSHMDSVVGMSSRLQISKSPIWQTVNL